VWTVQDGIIGTTIAPLWHDLVEDGIIGTENTYIIYQVLRIIYQVLRTHR